MEKHQYTTLTKEAFQDLIGSLNDINNEEFNLIPFEGSWTAGQLGKHMAMSNKGFLQLINGPIKETERDPQKWVETIKSDFLDFTTKTKSPSFVSPELKAYDKQLIISSLEKIMHGTIHAIETLNLSDTCAIFELPVYGYLTRYEALTFMIYHTKRHTRQLQEIKVALLAKKEIKKQL